MICPQRYRTHTGSSPERQTLRLGAQPLATLGLWAVCRGALPLAALTGDVMRRARYTPATPATSATPAPKAPKGGTPRSPARAKTGGPPVPEQGESRPQWAPGALGGSAKRKQAGKGAVEAT